MGISSPTSVAVYSGYDIEKVVRVYTGTYTSSSIVARTGSLGTIYVQKIPHDIGRPMMADVITSTDGGTTWNSGIGKVAFCDSSFVYIFTGYSPTVTNTDYKVYCSWINNFDATNPAITVQSYSSEPTQFDSRLNYQKIATQDVLSFTPGTFGSTQTQTITHSLGYTPNVKVYFEAFAGEVWPLNIGGARNALLYDGAQDECGAEIYSTYVDVTMYRFSNATRRAWYKVFYDAD